MIGVPFEDNDLWCLGHITEIVVRLVQERPAWLVELAARFKDTDELAAWIRSLPQRDDEGLEGDGPKVVVCEPWQRLRLPADDPNCVERSSLFLAVAELIDPWPVRRLSTLDFAWGRHTFPVEEGEPIVLDPRVTEAELMPAVPVRKRRRPHRPAEADALAMSSEPAPITPTTPLPATPAEPVPATRSASMPTVPLDVMQGGAAPAVPRTRVAVDVNDAIAYTSQLAQLGAQAVRNGPGRALVARNAIRNLVETGTPPRDLDTIKTIGWFFAVAEQVAERYGIRALTIVRTTARAIGELVDDLLAGRPRNLSFSLGGTAYEIPSWLTNLGSLAGKIGLNLGAAYVSPKLTALGITGPMIDLVEQELNAEGLTLGPIAKPGRSFSSALNALNSRLR